MIRAESPVPRLILSGEDSPQIARAPIVFDTRSILNAWSPEVVEFFPVWPGEEEGEERSADFNIQITREKDISLIAFRDSVEGDPDVYQNSEIEDGLRE